MNNLNSTILEKGQILFRCGNSKELLQVSASKNIKFDHVALVIDKNTVIEATPAKGVSLTTLEDFMKIGQVYVAKTDNKNLSHKAADLAMNFLNYPYNFTFDDSYKKGLYCSQLITKSFEIANGGKPYFKEDTLNFKDINGNIPTFWVYYYKKYNMSVPHGEKGSHPSRLFLDDKILERKPLAKNKLLELSPLYRQNYSNKKATYSFA